MPQLEGYNNNSCRYLSISLCVCTQDQVIMSKRWQVCRDICSLFMWCVCVLYFPSVNRSAGWTILCFILSDHVSCRLVLFGSFLAFTSLSRFGIHHFLRISIIITSTFHSTHPITDHKKVLWTFHVSQIRVPGNATHFSLVYISFKAQSTRKIRKLIYFTKLMLVINVIERSNETLEKRSHLQEQKFKVQLDFSVFPV